MQNIFSARTRRATAEKPLLQPILISSEHASLCLNRGVLLTPFHNMALMSPATTKADIDLHTRIFESAVGDLTAA